MKIVRNSSMTKPIRLELPTVFETMSVNSWLFIEPEPVLIDCGEKTDKTWDALNKHLHSHGLNISDISKVVITHGHLDHMGMANKICQHSNAEIWMNELIYDWAIDLEKMLDRRTDAILSIARGNMPKEGGAGTAVFWIQSIVTILG